MRRVTLIAILLSMTVIGSGCFLQPVNKVEKRFNYIDLDAPAMRLAKPIKAELLEKQGDRWVSIGKGIVPAGAYIKGRAPRVDVGKRQE